MQSGGNEAATERARVLIFAKAPIAGQVKTRLIPALGEEGAADVARRMLADAVERARVSGLPFTLLCEPQPSDPSWAGHLPPGVLVEAQAPGDIGARMAAASAASLARGEQPVLIGTDSPALGPERIRAMALALAGHDLAITPALDGGYASIALSRFDPRLFVGIRWSTDEVLPATLARADALGWTVRLFEPVADVDEPADLRHVPPDWLVLGGER